MTKEYKNEIEPIDDTINPMPKLNIPNAFNMFQTVTSAPTAVPTTWQNQIQIYSTGGVWRIYIWDNTGQVWKYATLT